MIKVPVLFISASRDLALPPELSANMESLCPQMRRESVEASHWALIEQPKEVNRLIGTWLEDAGQSKTHL